MIRQNNSETGYNLVGKVLSNFTLAMLCLCIAYFTAQGGNSENGHINSITTEAAVVDNQGNTSYCKKPTFHPCKDKSVLDFEQHGYNWPVNSTEGTYTVGDQTFEIKINDPDGIFGALHQPVDPDDIGSYESNSGIAVGINPNHRDDEIEIVYKLSKVSDKVAFTIKDLDKKSYYGSSKQIEKVCIYGYCEGEPVTPTVTSLCGHVYVKNNCAVATTDSYKSKKDESIRVVFNECLDEIKIVYGNASYAPKNPSYSKIYIGDDIGFGTALCHSECKKCTVEPSCLSSTDFAGCTTVRINPGEAIPVGTVNIVDPGIGENSAWVVTDLSNNILEVSEQPAVVLPEGTYNFYYINWDEDLSAPLNTGANLISIINNSECAALGKPQCVEVEELCNVKPASLGGEDFIVCSIFRVDLGMTVPINSIRFNDPGFGENSIWVVTDASNNIIEVSAELPISLGEGIYNFYFINWNGDLSAPLNAGANLTAIINNSECAALGEPACVEVENKCTAKPASISFEGEETVDICVNDETLGTFNFTLNNPGSGDNSLWVITDENGLITSNSTIAPSLDLYADELGTIQIWFVTWDGSLSSPPNAFTNVNQIVETSECAALSNPVVIVKDCCCPYSLDIQGAVVCIGNEIALNASLIVNENLISDDQTIVCEIEGFRRCSAEPMIFDQNGNKVQGQIDPNTPDIFKVTVDECRCAPDIEFTLDELDLTACGAGLPVAPIPQVVNVTENSATLNCQHEAPVIIEFRKSGDITFTTYNPAEGTSMLFLTGLEPCASYEYRSRVFDNNGNSTTCAIQTLNTSGCGNINIENINLTSLNVSATTAVLTWDNMPGFVYTFYYKIKGEEQWKSYDTTIPYLVLFGLSPCTDYEWALRISEDGLVSEISSTQFISTTCQEPRLSNPTADDIKIGNLSDLQNIELDLFVNPDNKLLTVNYGGLPVKNIGIYGVNGQLHNSLNVSDQVFSAIDVSDLEAGIYILIANLTNGVAKNKFIIHN